MKKIASKILSFVLVAASMVSIAGCEDTLSKIFSSTEDSMDSSTIDSSSNQEDCTHEFGAWVNVDATETKKGLQYRTCSKCGETELKTDYYFGDNDNDGFGNMEVEVVPYDGSEVTVTFYHTLGQFRQDVLNRHLEVFNDMYPNIHVEHVSKGSYPDLKENLEKEIEKGTAPTMAFCYPDHVAAYNRLGATVVLDDYIDHTGTVMRADGSTEIMGLTDAQKEDFIPSFYEEGRVYSDGKMYTLPFAKSTEVLYYNVDYFTENELTVPTTWDEMEATCARILEIESAKEGGLEANPCVPLGYDSEANWFITMTEQLGSGFLATEEGNEFAFNNEENRVFMEEFKEWYDLGYVTTGFCNGNAYTSDLFVQTDASQLKCYMAIGSSAGAGYHCPDRSVEDGSYPFEVGLAPVPQMDPDHPKMILQGPSVCLFKQENPQEVAAAWLLMEFLTTNANFQGHFSQVGGYAPVIQSIQQHPTYQYFLELADGNEYLWVSSVAYTMNYMSAYFIPPVTPNSNNARNIVGELMAEIFLNTPEEGQSLADYVKTYFDVAMDMLENHGDN